MFNPTYKDLCHLRMVLRKDDSDNSSFLLGKIGTEIDRLGDGLVPCCIRDGRPNQSRDVYYLGERGVQEKLHRAWDQGYVNGPRTILIICPNHFIAKTVFEARVLNEMSVVSVNNTRGHKAKLSSGQEIEVYSTSDVRHTTRGKSYDLTIIYTGADDPTA